MLDVHPPHDPTHSWRDFFVHIATIVVGLCIAVGLEQVVEYFHHRTQVREMREALVQEREENKSAFAKLSGYWRWETVALQNNLLVLKFLQKHPGAAEDQLPGVLYWGHRGSAFNHSTWDAAKTTGVTVLMPREEVATAAGLYAALDDVSATNSETWLATSEAASYLLSDANPTHLSSAEVAQEVALTRSAFNKHFLFGIALQNLRATFPDFPETVTVEELRKVRNMPVDGETGRRGPADALTKERLRAAGWAPYSIGPADVNVKPGSQIR